MKKNRVLLSILLGISFLVCTGCAPFLLVGGAAAGATIVGFIEGELVANDSATVNQAYASAQSGLTSLGYTITEKEKDTLTAKIVARGADDKRVEVKLKKKGQHVTEIRIRVAVFGDENLSREILKEIQRRNAKAQ